MPFGSLRKEIKTESLVGEFAASNLVEWALTPPLSSKYLDKNLLHQNNYVEARNRKKTTTLSKLVEKF